MTLCPLRLDTDALSIGSPWPINETLIKQYLRLDSSDDDAVLEVYLRAAIAWAENETHRTIFQRQSRWVLRDFPYWRDTSIRLPLGKAQSVESIQYISGGQVKFLYGATSGSPAGSDYQEDLRADSGGVLLPPQGASWPSVDDDVPAPILITFNAGWNADDVPAEILHAIMFAVSDMYDNRGSGIDLTVAGNSLAARTALISPYLLTRLY